MNILFTCTHWTSVGERHEWVVRFDPDEPPSSPVGQLQLVLGGPADVVLAKIEELLNTQCPRITTRGGSRCSYTTEQVVITAYIKSKEQEGSGKNECT